MTEATYRRRPIGSSAGEEPSPWQSSGGRCAVALREVFSWLGGADVCACAAVCREWRLSASEPALWRRLLLRGGAERPLLRAILEAKGGNGETPPWRDLFVRASAGWTSEGRLTLADGAPLEHCALEPKEPRRLAAVAGDRVSVWETGVGGRRVWERRMEGRGWSRAVRLQWAPLADRLLVAGELALSDDWELIALDVEEEGGRVSARVRCSAGAAGCWADEGDAFLSLSLARLAPRLAVTTVWLNSATQETQSEYAGVTTQLLRIFNEDHAHVTHAAVTKMAFGEDDTDSGRRALVTVAGRLVRTWWVWVEPPPPLLAAPVSLAERARLRRLLAAHEDEPAPEPDEASVRAACHPPQHETRMSATVVGFTIPGAGARAWVSLANGAVECLSLPTLRPLRRVAPFPSNDPSFASPSLHYVQPAVSDRYIVSPRGAWAGGGVVAWCSESGAPVKTPPACGAPVVAALLPPHLPDRLLLIAGEYLHVWRSRATLERRRDVTLKNCKRNNSCV